MNCLGSHLAFSFPKDNHMTQKEIIQKYFNVVVEGLRKQGWQQCVSGFPGYMTHHCAWSNGTPGVHCAVGHLIPEELHTGVRLTLQNSFTAYRERLLPKDLLEAMDKDADIQLHYIGVWQTMHDQGNTPEDMEAKFRQFVQAHDLILTWPEEQA